MSDTPQNLFVVFIRRNSGEKWKLWSTHVKRADARISIGDIHNGPRPAYQAKVKNYQLPPAPDAPKFAFEVGKRYRVLPPHWAAPSLVLVTSASDSSFEIVPVHDTGKEYSIPRWWTRRAFQLAYSRAEKLSAE